MVRPLADAVDVDVDMTITVDGREVDVWNEGDRVVVEVPSFAAARALFDGVETLPVPLDRAGPRLAGAGILVEIRVRYATVARLGEHSHPDALSRLLGVDPAEIDPAGAAVAAARWLL